MEAQNLKDRMRRLPIWGRGTTLRWVSVFGFQFSDFNFWGSGVRDLLFGFASRCVERIEGTAAHALRGIKIHQR